MLPAELYEMVQLLAAALVQVPACTPTPGVGQTHGLVSFVL